MIVTVKVYENGEVILEKELNEGVHRVGRSEFSSVVLEGDSVSRSHLELRVTESTVYLTNMSSAGKVKLNGKTLETGEIVDGDEIQIGNYRLVILFGGQASAEAPVPAVVENNSAEAPAEPAADGNNGNDFVNFDGSPRDDGGANAFGGNDAVAVESPPENNALEFPEPDGGGGGGDAFPVEGTAALNRAETVVEIKPVVAKLMFVEGPRKGEELFLEAYEVSLGRSKKADIFLDDEKLSRIHARITRVGMGYRLIDAQSRNGTYVNGMRVLEHPLSSFDTIEIGNSKIKFLIHDIISSDAAKGGSLVAASRGNTGGGFVGTPSQKIELDFPQGSNPNAQPLSAQVTRSLQMDPEAQGLVLELQRPNNGRIEPQPVFQDPPSRSPLDRISNQPSQIKRIILIAAILVGVGLLFLPNTKKPKPVVVEETSQAPKPPAPGDVRSPPAMSKEYLELTPEIQRAVEGYYNSALRAADRENFGEAVANLKRIHEVVPYYKQSTELLNQYTKRLREKQAVEAAEKAKKNDKQELSILLEDGMQYLKEGDFASAAESFNAAINLDPNNQTAIKGLKAAEYKVKSFDLIPPERDPEKEKRKAVADLFQKAVAAFTQKSYQEAIDTAEKIRQVELKGDTNYLNEAKQIIDRARMLQKDEFEPFLIQAKEKYAEGDYNASRDLCEEMLKRDGAYDDAKECVFKAKKQLNRLAKEAYTHGYILESMNRLEEAKQYWNRAKNYVRKGDDYYDKVMKKLDYYQ